jgi:hypothetical protein
MADKSMAQRSRDEGAGCVSWVLVVGAANESRDVVSWKCY